MSDGQTSSWPIPVRGRRSGLTSLELAMGASGPTTWARRFPSLRLEQPHSIRRLLVSAFLADSIQHIHSLRASGVISSHAVSTCGSDVSAFFKSGCTSCTTPLEILFCDINNKLSFRKPQRREDLLLSKGCGSFGHLASPDAQVNSALDYPLRSCDAPLGKRAESGVKDTYR